MKIPRPAGEVYPSLRLLDLTKAGDVDPASTILLFTNWRLALESNYPNLLSADDVQRRERILLKLLRLVPKEYQAGVRDGEIVVPLEYRHAKRFTIQSEQIVNELMPVWRRTKADALEKHGNELFGALDAIETVINKKLALREIQNAVSRAMDMLERDFGLSLKRPELQRMWSPKRPLKFNRYSESRLRPRRLANGARPSRRGWMPT